MPFKTPTSSLTAAELLVAKVWWRGTAGIERLLFGGTPVTPTLRPSPIARLPQELIELIISYLIGDTPTLLACSMTCYSWYIAAAPHLHHTLTTRNSLTNNDEGKSNWPRPLRNSYNLGLLPFVKRFHIRTFRDPFTPGKLDRSTLRYFSALKNLQELGIDELQVPSFMPNIQRYFGHFTPTLRSLVLWEPVGSSRQILYFIGLFSNLQDLKISYFSPNEEREGMAGADLVPLSVPPLCGRLTLKCFAKEKLVKDMITFFWGLRFRYMDLFRVKCVRLLLDTCADTLEGLRLYPTDPYENHEAVCWALDLSRNSSLRTLETTAASITTAGEAASGFLKTVLSTVTSPLPLELVIDYGMSEVHCYRASYIRLGIVSQNERAADALVQQERFKAFSEMYAVRQFRLVLRAGVSGRFAQGIVWALESIVKEARMNEKSNYLPCEPVIQYFAC